MFFHCCVQNSIVPDLKRRSLVPWKLPLNCTGILLYCCVFFIFDSHWDRFLIIQCWYVSLSYLLPCRCFYEINNRCELYELFRFIQQKLERAAPAEKQIVFQVGASPLLPKLLINCALIVYSSHLQYGTVHTVYCNGLTRCNVIRIGFNRGPGSSILVQCESVSWGRMHS